MGVSNGVSWKGKGSGMRSNVLVLAAAIFVNALAYGENIENPSFEAGMRGWEVEYAKKLTDMPFAVEKGGHKSAHAIRITTPTRFGLVKLATARPVKFDDPAKAHTVSFHCRISDPLFQRAVGVQADYQDTKGNAINPLKGRAWELYNPMVLYLVGEEKSGEWVKKTYVIPPVKDAKSVRIIVEFYGVKGEARLDGFEMREAPAERTPEKISYYNPFGFLGRPPVANFLKLQEDNSPFLKSSDKYHRVMVAQSMAQEKLERLERACFYLGAKTDASLPAENKRILGNLSKLYEKYGELFIAKESARLKEELDQPLALLGKDIKAFSEKIVHLLSQKAQEAGMDAQECVDFEKPLPRKKIVIDEKGRPNQLVFSSLSRAEHFDMEYVLGDIQRIYRNSLTAKRSKDKKSLDFSEIIKSIKKWKAKGVEYAILHFPLCDSTGSLVMPQFYYKNQNNPQIYMQKNYKGRGVKFSKWYKKGLFNIFNPAVRKSMREVARTYAKALKNYKKIYIFNWEDRGPSVDGRTGGYGEVARQEFQKHLEKKFGTIDNLNKALRTYYKSFAEIHQPIDKRSLMGNPTTETRYPIPATRPLAYEFERWIHQVHTDLCISIYKEVKKHDPGAVVLSGHNDILYSLGYDPMSLFEYSDMIGNHAKPFLIDIFRGLARHRGDVNFGAFEDQWGMEWEDDRRIVHRPAEERAWRNYVIRHIGRIADRDYTHDSWWYSYTRAAFILTYGSANWANPVYDVSIFRYFITGLPTGINLVRKFEKEFMTTRKVPSRILLLLPEASFYHQYPGGNSYHELRGLRNVLFPLNYSFESTTERLVLSGKEDLTQFDIIMSPFAPYYPDGLWDKLGPWIKDGGTLVSVGPCGIYDEYGFDNPKSLTRPYVKAEFPAGALNHNRHADVVDWDWKNGDPVQVHQAGKGKIALITRPMHGIGQSRKLLSRFLDIFKDVRRKAKSPDTPAELTLRKDKGGRYYLFALNPNGDAKIQGHIEVLGKFSSAKDLGIAGGFPVKTEFDNKTGYTRFAFELAPGNFTMFDLVK